MGIQKSDLVYEKSYKWTVLPNDDPRITGIPDSTLLNRHEGYEVLHFINKFMKDHNLTTVTAGQKVEKKIHDELPSDIRSHKNVSEWIVANWNK